MTSTDQELSALLSEWRESPAIPSGFRRDVWSRIEGRVPVSQLGGWLSILALPRFAVSAAVIAVFVGMVAGNLQARSAGEALYLRSVDPLSFHAHGQ